MRRGIFPDYTPTAPRIRNMRLRVHLILRYYSQPFCTNPDFIKMKTMTRYDMLTYIKMRLPRT